MKYFLENPSAKKEESSSTLGWNAVYLQTSNFNPNNEHQLNPIYDENVLFMLLQGSTKIVTTFKDPNLNKMGNLYFPGVINLIPRQLQIDGLWDSQYRAGFWFLSYPAMQRLAAEVAQGDPEHIFLSPKFRFQDPLLQNLLLTLVKELEDKSSFSALYADSISHTIMLYLLKNYSNAAKVTLPRKSVLSPEQRHRLEDYIEAHLASNITIADLANLLHFSVPHLTRCFRIHYGLPIHRYIIHRRIERAKVLLYDKRRSLFDIALECGFADQSHFNHQFKAHIGVSPKQYLNAIKGND